MFAAGSNGYKALQALKIPLPGIRALQRRTQVVRFEPGVLTEVFDFLIPKTSGSTDLERECVLTIDEMAITPCVELHTLSGKLYGDVTLPGHTGVAATHACVYVGWKHNMLEASYHLPFQWKFNKWSSAQANN